MSKKKAKSKVKLLNLTEVLKKVYLEKITNKLSDEDFIVKVRDVVIRASKKDNVTAEEILLLKNIAQNYIAIFIKGKSVKLQDVEALASFTFEKWIKEDDMVNVSTLISARRGQALKLEAGTRAECEAMIITIGKLFAVQGATKQMQSDHLIELIQGRFLKVAKLEFNKLSIGQFNPTELKELLVRVFTNTFELQDMQYLAKVVDTFKINLKSFAAQSKSGGICTALTFFLSLPTPQLKEQYLRLLKEEGVHPDSDLDRPDFVAMDSMTLLMYCCNKEDRESVELLLRYGADINKVIKVVNKHGVMTFRTPFSVSIGSADIDFVKYLVSQGANPLKAMNLFKEFVASFMEGPLGSNLKLMPTMGYGAIPVEIREEYFSQVFSIIEQCYLKELLTYSEVLEAQGFEEEKEFKTVDKLSKHSASSAQKKGVQELVSEYISFKKLEQDFLEQDAATIENTFDILLLKFCQNGSEEILDQLHGHINSNPELHHYAISSILESTKSAHLAREIFMHTPSLLHKFFTLKKQLCDSSLQQNKASIVPEGVYEMRSNLKNTVYVAIALDLRGQLEEQSPGLYNKFTQKLSDCRFIKSDSKDMPGIKTYKGVIKLKIAGEDISIATNKKYLDKSTGKVLIIFDRIYTHKDKIGSSIITQEVETFDQVWQFSGALGEENQDFIEGGVEEGFISFDPVLEKQSSVIIGELVE